MILFNQKGSIDLFYAFLCLILLSVLSYYTVRKIQQWKHMKKNLAQIICIKELNRMTKDFIKDINLFNQIIIAENILQIATLFFPTTWLSQHSLAQVKKATKKLQIVRLGSYLYEIGRKTTSGCRYDPMILKTPYKINWLSYSFIRNTAGITQLRKNKWKRCHILNLQVICFQYSLEGSLSRKPEIKTNHYFLPREI